MEFSTMKNKVRNNGRTSSRASMADLNDVTRMEVNVIL